MQQANVHIKMKQSSYYFLIALTWTELSMEWDNANELKTTNYCLSSSAAWTCLVSFRLILSHKQIHNYRAIVKFPFSEWPTTNGTSFVFVHPEEQSSLNMRIKLAIHWVLLKIVF